ncbi:hypothetical protein LTR91_009481 [Friedmanniomyces endolithicus]|uniref:Uncharacterized protein n=1 Tax=Friedmanniomyces endolithicus TaxID=329885 RepID=A0AAN6QT35_9PEZI|nr:hypothetical protein LTR94_013531 [Friedmanniomyces endolithicus]KAK0781393.1 hypothetical protein LTR59_012490 [Friedmanniomyces endolithicus]KAK0840727.1 hypothetical protein LTR03_010405 [Friedmanniomyces endolithicus]KAK0857825.1 hypothetical protein LTS02_010063 [Friedmanniomyces endolithicus]KAK0874738.1 hypothetical protein LTR87_011452 [Friedmanniomyces endolithicus]
MQVMMRVHETPTRWSPVAALPVPNTKVQQQIRTQPQPLLHLLNPLHPIQRHPHPTQKLRRLGNVHVALRPIHLHHESLPARRLISPLAGGLSLHIALRAHEVDEEDPGLHVEQVGEVPKEGHVGVVFLGVVEAEVGLAEEALDFAFEGGVVGA